MRESSIVGSFVARSTVLFGMKESAHALHPFIRSVRRKSNAPLLGQSGFAQLFPRVLPAELDQVLRRLRRGVEYALPAIKAPAAVLGRDDFNGRYACGDGRRVVFVESFFVVWLVEDEFRQKWSLMRRDVISLRVWIDQGGWVDEIDKFVEVVV